KIKFKGINTTVVVNSQLLIKSKLKIMASSMIKSQKSFHLTFNIYHLSKMFNAQCAMLNDLLLHCRLIISLILEHQ
ncbi:MAG: hypothetical protein ACRC8K_19800, partial [Waterburya sp.]